MPLPAPEIWDTHTTISGTLVTTIQVVTVHTPRILFRWPVTGTGPVFVATYSPEAATAASLDTGDAAPSGAGVPYYVGDSDEIGAPQPGRLPWKLVWWGTAGDEVVYAQGRP